MMDNDLKFIVKRIVFVILLFIFVALLMHHCETIQGYDKYNNGVCSKCGGTYMYQQAIGHQHETYYIYMCDQCGNLIEVNKYYERNN